MNVGNSGNSPNSPSTTHNILHNTSSGTDAQVGIRNIINIIIYKWKSWKYHYSLKKINKKILKIILLLYLLLKNPKLKKDED